ncbi:hypothetical protein GGI11_000087 [Coemansia sp. RSA 2049]|nr:hypothetical protein GGI11_000087 [Coemansia sp. RSA 2049]
MGVESQLKVHSTIHTRVMDSLVSTLKTLERVRKEQITVIERLNQIDETEAEGATTTQQQQQENVERAGKLAQQEQKAAEAALEQVGRLLQQHEQRAREDKRRRVESRSRERERDRERDREAGGDRLRRREHLTQTSGSGSGSSGAALGSGSVSASQTQTPSAVSSHQRGENGGDVISKGSLVAARVAPAGAVEEEWILATVVSYSSEKNRYTVQDHDLESAERPTYVLSPRLVLLAVSASATGSPTAATAALSGHRRRSLWDRARNPEMPRGQRVLALYPRTTAFYQGTVVIPPSLNGDQAGSASASVSDSATSPDSPHPSTNPMYRLLFDDDDNQEVDVPAHLVLPVPLSR